MTGVEERKLNPPRPIPRMAAIVTTERYNIAVRPLGGAMKFLLLVLLYCGQAIFADDGFTAGFTNGRGWAAMPISVKAGFLSGFSQGSGSVKQRCKSDAHKNELWGD